MTTEARQAALAELLDEPTRANALEALKSWAPEQLAELLVALKAEVDERMLRSPPDGLRAAEALMALAPLLPGLRHLALRGFANALHYNARHQEARAAYEEAMAVYAARGEEREVATIMRNLVDVLMYLGDSAGALQYASQARSTLERLNLPADLARLENNVGNVYLRQDEYPLAREHYERASKMFRELKYPRGVGLTAFNLGIVEMNANDVDASERCLLAAREAFSEAKFDLHVADCDYNLAYLLSRRGRFSEAIEGLEQASRTYALIGKPTGPPLCDLDLAEIYLRLDVNRNALRHAEDAARGFEKLGLRYEAARCGILEGLAHMRMGRPNEALDRLQAAADTFRELDNDAAAAAVDVQRAAIEIDKGALNEAVARLKSARDTLNARHLRFLTDYAGVTLARAYIACGETALARSLLESMLHRQGDSTVFDALLKADALSLLAAARRSEGDAAGATQALRESFDTTEKSYTALSASDIRIAFFRDRHLAYVELVWDLAEEGSRTSRAEALRILEETRGRSLNEEQESFAGLAPELARARARLDWMLARHVDAEFGHSEVGHGATDHDLRHASPQSAELLMAQDEVLRLSRRAPKSGPEVRRVDGELLSRAAGGSDLLVFYVSGPRGVRAFVVDGEAIDDVRLPIAEEQVARLRNLLWLHADKLRFGGGYLAERREMLEGTLRSLFDQLGAGLLGPLAERLRGRSVVLVPFGDLHDLPLHALRVNGAPLVERCSVSYALSAASLATQRGASSHGTALFASGAAPAGLSDIEGEIADLRQFYPALETLPPQALIEGLERRAFAGRMLHLAAHAMYRHSRPAFSGICLGERFLLAHDLLRLRMPFDLVVLSGCATGRRRRVPGEETFGLTRALFGAGARSVLATLWAVEDQAARSFMRAFHTELSSGNTAREALARAQRQLSGAGQPITTWAAFGLLGDPTVRIPTPAPQPGLSQ